MCLGGCTSDEGREPGVYTVLLTQDVTQSAPRHALHLEQMRSGTVSFESVSVVAGEYPVRELLLSNDDALVLVGVGAQERWIRHAPPLRSSRRTMLREVDTSGPGVVHVRFFADGHHAFVTTREHVAILYMPQARVRILDRVGATLEGCRMTDDLLHLECSLDMGWGASARFDSDGNELTGDFQPAWSRPGG